MSSKPFAPACERNREPILEQLRPLLKSYSDKRDPMAPVDVLEIGSGTGQHAVFFSRELSGLNVRWQPTDMPGQLDGIAQWMADVPCEHCLAPQALDLATVQWPEAKYDVLFTANTLHIVDWALVEKLLEGAAKTLVRGGLLIIYGPFNYNGNYSSESNRDFDQWLKARDPRSAIRDFEAVCEFAAERAQPLVLQQDIAMPANNRLLVFCKD